MFKTAAIQSAGLGMDTGIFHAAYGKYAEKAIKAVNQEAWRLEQLLSYFIPTSEISKINQSAGAKCEQISSDTYEILSRSIHFSACSNGTYDATIGPLVNLWTYKTTSEIPESEKVKEVLPFVNYSDLYLDPVAKTAGLKKNRQCINLGGIGKGFASDKFLEIFRNYGIKSALTNLGGNVAALGSKPDGSPWSIGIQHPRLTDSLLGVVAVTDKSVVTSGDYQRYFIDRTGKRRHHILDPTTGYPSESELISVTVVADNGTTADALSTIIFITGINTGLNILKGFPGTEAIFVDKDLTVYITAGLRNSFHPADKINIQIIT
ncbi:FAD:protein FMN transferase [Anaerocolumna sp. MB42-C2]|uniref:FAD:protein FMN transferase n=1 Tax=Anaerocolumna sp. MB42-C2 TaxID=3070997 RepID=UPI0027E1CA7A|nr:FAD:protein FMN transferase [Anaerocolumna sp. MB42-C2]WMJ90299.1 FAD:protein FMN transferase [Anaerocolumna sp. MB42-C2]